MKLEPMKPIRVFPNEVFKEVIFQEKFKFRYAVSNKGRMMSFEDDIRVGRILTLGRSDGYQNFRYKLFNNGKIKNKAILVYKLVAELFVPKTSEDQLHVIHLDRVRDNDDYRNLKWVTRREMLDFAKSSPHVIQARKNLIEHNIKSDGRKLTVTKVMLIKKMLARPDQKTRMKMIAKQFGVSEMQISRIKRGENWGHIKV